MMVLGTSALNKTVKKYEDCYVYRAAQRQMIPPSLHAFYYPLRLQAAGIHNDIVCCNANLQYE